MPIYEYRCGACGHTLDALQKVSDDPLTDCPQCSAAALKRLISAPSFRLKGKGWYETDFKSEKDRKRNLVDAAAEKPAEDKPKEDQSKEGKVKEGKVKEGKVKEAKAETKSSEPASDSKKSPAKGKGSGSEAA